MTTSNGKPRFDIKDKLFGAVILCLSGMQAAMWADIRTSRDDIKILIAQSGYEKGQHESMRKDVDDIKKKVYGQNTVKYSTLVMKKEDEYTFKLHPEESND